MEEEVKKALEVIRKGGIILYPTDTIWGIGCDAANSKAIKKIYALKQRSDSKSMILLVSDIAMLERTVGEIPSAAEMLLDVAVDPLTIIYDQAYGVAPECVASDGSVGIRVPEDEFCKTLCRGLRRPIVSTSANFSGSASPKCFSDIDEKLIDGVDYVVDWKRNEMSSGRPSNIIKVGNDNVVNVLR